MGAAGRGLPSTAGDAVLECVINISEGRDLPAVTLIALEVTRGLLDVHSDRHHNRSVLTLAGPDVEDAAMAVTHAAVQQLDIRAHAGAHPRLGVVDVVPFVPLAGTGATMAGAVAARDSFARRAAAELGVPAFLYGPERSLPEVRRTAFRSLPPDVGPRDPHPTAGAVCAGARGVLVAYNLWLAEADMDTARRLARSIRRPEVRALAFDAGGPQVSCNLVAPGDVGPAEVYDRVASGAKIARAEVVGLLPAAVVAAVPRARWAVLGLSTEQTIEARLEQAGQAGLDGGS